MYREDADGPVSQWWLIEFPLIAGTPWEPLYHNARWKPKREGLKSKRIGKSAAKLRLGEGSTTIALSASTRKRGETGDTFQRR